MKEELRDQVIAKTRVIEEHMELIEEGLKRVENARKVRIESCLQMFSEYRSKVGSYLKY